MISVTHELYGRIASHGKCLLAIVGGNNNFVALHNFADGIKSKQIDVRVPHGNAH